MMSRQLAVVILAAGQGTRMKSAQPKVLHPVAGMPMLQHVVRTASALNAFPIVAVVGHGADLVTQAMEAPFLEFVHQKQQLGTGHALICAKASLAQFEGDLLLLCGDVPLLQSTTLENLIRHHRKSPASLTILTAEINEPTGYGRIIRGENGVERIVEEKDAKNSERNIKEINTGIYLFNAPDVFKWLANIGNRNAQGEYYLTDVVTEAQKFGHHVEALKVENTDEIMGINDRVQLSVADRLMRLRINEFHQHSGVTIIDPHSTYIEPDVTIGPDTILLPGVHLRGQTQIGNHCTIEPGVVITDCQVGHHVHIKSGSVLTESHIGDACLIGPMAHLRPGTVLKGHNKIGNFVETKKAVIGEKSQASHLSYLGDADLGKNVNIGCGTITCNYDGVNKHQTVIEDDVFVGSDTQFVAPVSIGHGSLIAAGSTITKDVPADALAISRSDQKIVDGWAAKKRKKAAKINK
jgi:bifunctional UDP-N-acetylglucosamine pyrophosphorylase/glucosamine-1-phosphate N-acetyltransferase